LLALTQKQTAGWAVCLLSDRWGTIDDFYFGGVKMKKLGWGLGMSGWLISMFLILQTGCE
ncbi:hypothetical protein PY82_13915, partial [Lacticaseibacillus rhamnosus]